MEGSEEHVIVIGAGVLGLSCAQRLKDAGYRVTVVAKNLPGDLDIDYASPWAGAHFRPVPVTNKGEALERKLSQETYAYFKELASKHPEAGISIVPGIEYFDAPSKTYTDLKPEQGYSSWEGFQVLPAHALPPDAQWGVQYDAWVLNSPVYLQWQQQQLELDGSVTFIRASVSTPLEAFELVTSTSTSSSNSMHPHLKHLKGSKGKMTTRAIINATGTGFNDPRSYISRGQFLLVSNIYDRTISHHRPDGSSTVVVPRPCGGGTLIGGTKEVHAMHTEADDEATTWILQETAKLCPDMLTPLDENDPKGEELGLRVLRVNVGRRPMRIGGLRIEREELPFSPNIDRIAGQSDPVDVDVDGPSSKPSLPFIVHCYGAGGSGFKVSWGAARMVLELVQQQEVN